MCPTVYSERGVVIAYIELAGVRRVTGYRNFAPREEISFLTWWYASSLPNISVWYLVLHPLRDSLRVDSWLPHLEPKGLVESAKSLDLQSQSSILRRILKETRYSHPQATWSGRLGSEEFWMLLLRHGWTLP